MRKGERIENNSRNVKSGNIAGDGSLVLKLYYSRNEYNISYEKNGGTMTSTGNKYTYGKEFILPTTTITKTGYTFDGWYTDSSLNKKVANSDGTLIANVNGYTNSEGKWIRKENTTLYAKWTINYILGDVNQDGKINSADYVRIKNHIMEREIIKDSKILLAADVNKDGKISSADYVKIKNYIMKGEEI